MEECGLLCPTDELHLFCLHYVFLPRLNLQLAQFLESWNNHRLRTEHGLSPKQLWTKGICIADPSVLDQPSVTDDYGVDYGEQPNPFDLGSVIVPEIDLNLSDTQMEELQAHHSPILHSDYHGLDIYLAVRETLSRILSG